MVFLPGIARVALIFSCQNDTIMCLLHPFCTWNNEFYLPRASAAGRGDEAMYLNFYTRSHIHCLRSKFYKDSHSFDLMMMLVVIVVFVISSFRKTVAL